MAEAQKGGEQSMDDILASIRRIISDDPLAPGPAGIVESEGNSTLLGAQAEPDLGVLPSESTSTGAARLRNPTDDLSDILEPSKVPSAQQGVSAARAEESSSNVKREGEQSVSSWAFDPGSDKPEFGGSLKDKLASLDGRGQPTRNPEIAPIADGDGTAATPDISLPDRESLDGASALDGGPLEPSLGNGEAAAEMASPVQSVPGAVKLSDADVASIPSVQAAVEQTAADARSGKEVPAAQTETIEPQNAETRQDEAVSLRKPAVVSDERVSAPETEAPAEGETVSSAGVSPAVAISGVAATDVPASRAKTLESLVSEALEPKLQQWLDANLPRLVEEKLQAEIERLSRDGKLRTN